MQNMENTSSKKFAQIDTIKNINYISTTIYDILKETTFSTYKIFLLAISYDIFTKHFGVASGLFYALNPPNSPASIVSIAQQKHAVP